MTQKNYNIIRFKRIKHNSQIKNTTSHNFRIHSKIRNVDYTKTSENIYLVGDNHIDLNNEFNNLKERYKFKYIKDKFNMFDEFVISASPDFFKNLSKQEQIQYFKDNISILQKHFFKVPGSVVSAVIHFDESTPHCHIVACPLVMDTQKTIARGKDKGKIIQGEFYSLSHEKILGKKQQCRELQTVFNQELNKLGWNVARGRKNTGIKHQELKEFNRAVEDFHNTRKPSLRLDRDLRNFEDLSFFKKLQELPLIIEKIQDSLNTINKHYKAFKAALKENYELKKQNEQLKTRLDKQASTRSDFDNKLLKLKNVAITEIKKLEQQRTLEKQELNQQITMLERENKQIQSTFESVNNELNLVYEVLHSDAELNEVFNNTIDKMTNNAPKINSKKSFKPY